MVKKYGTGEIIPEDEDEKKTAASNWTEKDQEELEQELAEEEPEA